MAGPSDSGTGGRASALCAFLEMPEDTMLVRLARVEGSAPREEGTFMLVRPQALFGTIGGGFAEFDAIAHALGVLDGGWDYLVLLQPTSPLRTADDIRAAFGVMEEKQAESVVSVCEMEHSPLWCNTLPPDGSMRAFIRADGNKRRQELEPYYRMNGAVYLVKTEHFLRTGSLYGDGCYAYIMSAERSVDIDNPTDFLFAECLLNARSE